MKNKKEKKEGKPCKMKGRFDLNQVIIIETLGITQTRLSLELEVNFMMNHTIRLKAHALNHA